MKEIETPSSTSSVPTATVMVSTPDPFAPPNIRKRTELNITPSPSLSPNSSSNMQSTVVYSSSPPKKSGIPMPINGHISTKKESRPQKSPVVVQNKSTPILPMETAKEQASVDADYPLCDDILSCISALDEVIAEFDEPISFTNSSSTITDSFSIPSVVPCSIQEVSGKSSSNVNSDASQLPQTETTQKPTFSRLITTLSTRPQEPSVTIMQKESQTVTKIQIGSSQANKTSSSTSVVSTASSSISSPTRPATAPTLTSSTTSNPFISWKTPQVTVSQNNDNINHHQNIKKPAETAKPQTVVQLKQSDFSPVVVSPSKTTLTASSSSVKPKRPSSVSNNNKYVSPTTAYQDPLPIESFISTSPDSPNNNFTNYEIIFPKSPTQNSCTKKVVNMESRNNNNTSNSAGESEGAYAQIISQDKSAANNGKGSYPKIKGNNANIEESQDKISTPQAVTDLSTTFYSKPSPPSNNLVIVKMQKENGSADQDSFNGNDINFPFNDKLPRSLRKTGKVILDDENDQDVKNSQSLKKSQVVVVNNNNGHNSNMTNTNNNNVNHNVAASRNIDNDSSEQQVILMNPPVRNQKKLKSSCYTESDSRNIRQSANNRKVVSQQQQQQQNQNNVYNNFISNNDNFSGGGTYSKKSYPPQIDSILGNQLNRAGKEQGKSRKPKLPLEQPSTFLPILTSSEEYEEQLKQRVSRREKQENQVPSVTNAANNNIIKSGNVNSSSHHQKHYKQHQQQQKYTSNGKPINLTNPNVQLDVDDGYLSMINRHDPPIIWPEAYIESETFTPEELKRLSSSMQKQKDNHFVKRQLQSSSVLLEAEKNKKSRISNNNQLLSSLAMSDEKTDYFSDDSLEIEEHEQNENLHLSYVIATHDEYACDAIMRQAKSIPDPSKMMYPGKGSNVWQKPIPPVIELAPSSPVKKPCAFFIPLDETQSQNCNNNKNSSADEKSQVTVITQTETSISTNLNPNDVKDQKAIEEKNKHGSKSEPETVNKDFLKTVDPLVNRVVENVLTIAIQEASAISYLLTSAQDEDIEIPDVRQGGFMNEIAQPIPPPSPQKLDQESTSELFESLNEFPLRTSQYEADCEDEDEDEKEEIGTDNNESHEWKEVEFIEDFDQPPPFIPAPPPAVKIFVKGCDVIRTPETVNQVSDLQSPGKEARQSVGSLSSIPKITELDKRPSPIYKKSVHRSVDPEIDYRIQMKQASRSHENLLDIKKSRQNDFWTPKRNGQSCTLPPNAVPPVCNRRPSAFRQLIGIFKRKNKDQSCSGDVPDSPFEDIQFSFGRRNMFPALAENQNGHTNAEVYNERKISFGSNSPHGSARSTKSTPVKKSVLSRIFRRKEK